VNAKFVLDECHCNHLTHFAQIFSPSGARSRAEEDMLNFINQVGCCISLVCLCGVFLVAAFHRKWLEGAGQKILLQMAANLALLLVIILVGDFVDVTASTECVVYGFFLHYAILTNFVWKGVAGYLQYRRLVTVIHQRPVMLVAKVAVVGWGLPVVPGAIILISGQFREVCYLALTFHGFFLIFWKSLFPFL
jgi:hypothetical protein